MSVPVVASLFALLLASGALAGAACGLGQHGAWEGRTVAAVVLLALGAAVLSGYSIVAYLQAVLG